jgi:hypothetical protein
MPEPRAQRTLVKSPPELWAEISDPGALAKHLGEFGEIRITRIDPETTVAWEGERVSGTVALEPSGWGTKVTLTAQVDESPPEPVAVEPEPSVVEPEPVAVEPEPVAVEAERVVVEPEPEPGAVVPERVVVAPEPEPVAEPPEAQAPAPLAPDPLPSPAKPGFFARLFGKRAAAATAPEPVAKTVPEAVGPVAPEPVVPIAPAVDRALAPARDDAVPVTEPVVAVAEPVAFEPEPAAIAPEAPSIPKAVEEPVAPEPEPPAAKPLLDAGRAQALLVEALDTLGSAHHRPFSRG